MTLGSAKDWAFWDSSALTPLCVDEAVSQLCQQLRDEHPAIVWWGTHTEIRSAVARLHREGKLTERSMTNAIAKADVLERGWVEVSPSDEVRVGASRLLREYPLRAAESLQLAAAIVWCKGRAAGRKFVCGDHKLSRAAEAEGFYVVEVM